MRLHEIILPAMNDPDNHKRCADGQHRFDAPPCRRKSWPHGMVLSNRAQGYLTDGLMLFDGNMSAVYAPSVEDRVADDWEVIR